MSFRKKQISAFYLIFLVVVVVVTALVSVKLATRSIVEEIEGDTTPTEREEDAIEEGIFDLETDDSTLIEVESDEEPAGSDQSSASDEGEGDTEEANDFEDGEKFIRISSPSHNRVFNDVEEVVFTGEVAPNTDKIVVNALVVSDKGKTFNAIYTIDELPAAGGDFQYTSKLEWKNLTPGTNHYHFKAFFKDGTSQSKSVTVYLEETEEE